MTQEGSKRVQPLRELLAVGQLILQSCKAKVATTHSVPPPPCEKPSISPTGLNPAGDGGREVLGCDTEGTGTSVSHEPRGAALAFTGCVIFLQAFHNVNSELFFAKNWDRGE